MIDNTANSLIQLERLTAFLHEHEMHPDFEYATTKGPRPLWADEDTPPRGLQWKRNVDKGDKGFDRFGLCEESYWRRTKRADGKPVSQT